MVKNQKGITLIALIITIIVMLILVGVTINVALNGGLFGKGEKAAYQTDVSTIKEKIEIEKSLLVMNNNGKAVSDYSGIKVENLDGISKKAKEDYKDKILVSATGEICYNSEKVTDSEEKAWLEEIGIKPYTGGISFYEVGYINTNSGSSKVMPVFFLKNNFMIILGQEDYMVQRYTENGNIIRTGNATLVLSDDYKTITQESIVLERDENYKYIYNPTKSETYGIYLGGIYTSTVTDTIIATSETRIILMDTINSYPLEEMESKGIEVSEDGKQLIYKGEIYNLEK